MHYPLINVDGWKAITIVAAVLGAALVFVFLRGVCGLVEGTADYSVRRNVRAGTHAAKVLVALIPVTILVVIIGPGLEALPLWVLIQVAGVGVLVVYFRQCKKYWTHVQSVA
jgi:hypothetical protein